MRGLFLFILAYIPFQIALNIAPGFDVVSSRVLIPLLFLGWLAHGFQQRWLRVPLNPQTLLILFFLGLAFTSALIAENTEFATRKLLFWLSIFPIYFVSAALHHPMQGERFFQKPEWANRAIKVILHSAFVAALIGFIQFLAQFFVGAQPLMSWWVHNIGPIFWGKTVAETVGAYQSLLVNLGGETVMRLVSLFPDPHMAAFYFGMTAFLSLSLIFNPQTTKKSRLWYSVIGLSLLLATLLTFSRGAYLALIVAGIVGLVIYWKCLSISLKRVASAIVVMAALALILPGNPISDRLHSSFDQLDNSVAERALIWSQATQIIAEHPLLGVGLGNYAYHLEPAAHYRTPIYAHNTYLDIAVELGILPAVLFALLIIYSITTSLITNTHHSRALALTLIFFATYALIDTPIFSPRVLPLLLVILALTTIQTKEEAEFVKTNSASLTRRSFLKSINVYGEPSSVLIHIVDPLSIYWFIFVWPSFLIACEPQRFAQRYNNGIVPLNRIERNHKPIKGIYVVSV